MKLGSNSVEDHPQLSHNRHPVDGAWVGAGSLWRFGPTQSFFLFLNMAFSLVGGVKFMASPLYFKGILFGYKRVALVVFQVIMSLRVCNFFAIGTFFVF
jgi:hypothetical protein